MNSAVAARKFMVGSEQSTERMKEREDKKIINALAFSFRNKTTNTQTVCNIKKENEKRRDTYLWVPR